MKTPTNPAARLAQIQDWGGCLLPIAGGFVVCFPDGNTQDLIAKDVNAATEEAYDLMRPEIASDGELRSPEAPESEPPVRVQPVMPHDLESSGGKWLGAAREWLQWHTVNGDSIHWGSRDEIRPPFTVEMIERLAATVAAAAINEERERVRIGRPLGRAELKPL